MKFTIEQIELITKVKRGLIELKENQDTEVAHVKADDLLCELLNGLNLNDIVKEFEYIEKWYA